MTKFRARTDLIPSSSVSLLKKSTTRTELQRTILIAVPDSVEFRNYESGRLYQKVITLRNISTSLARFQLRARPSNSRFTVIIKSKSQKKIIPAGLHVKLVIFFRCDVLDEPNEILIINVQQGCPVIIKLRGYRDIPILRVINIPYLRCPQKLQAITKDTEWVIEIPFEQSNSYEEFSSISNDALSTSSTSTESVHHCRKLNGFDCGECFVGEQVTLSLMVKNIGGEGRFFIMSEIDWCSMHIEDVNNKNMLILPSFAMWPAYFTLKPQEHIYLYIYFFPNTHGMHVETLYAICDNCSLIITEIVGDGIIHE